MWAFSVNSLTVRSILCSSSSRVVWSITMLCKKHRANANADVRANADLNANANFFNHMQVCEYVFWQFDWVLIKHSHRMQLSFLFNTKSQKHLSRVKFVFSKKATKFEKNVTVDLTHTTYFQIDGEDFVNFCGLLRKHELYNRKSSNQKIHVCYTFCCWIVCFYPP